MDTNDDAKGGSRRRHGDELKRRVLAECVAPGASVASVAMAHGLNANLVHKWRRAAVAKAERGGAAFVPVAVAPLPVVSEASRYIELELQRGPINVKVRWPLSSAPSCAAWLREILR